MKRMHVSVHVRLPACVGVSDVQPAVRDFVLLSKVGTSTQLRVCVCVSVPCMYRACVHVRVEDPGGDVWGCSRMSNTVETLMHSGRFTGCYCTGGVFTCTSLELAATH